MKIVGIPTSYQAERRAREYGIPLATLHDYTELDIAIDGADQIDPKGNLIKGRGAAQTQERCVASASRLFVVVADAGKIVTCSEIAVELHDNDVTSWLSSAHCVIIPIDDEIQRNVIKVVTTYPRLVDIGRNKSSGDPFLIATAMKYDLTVITEEGKDSPRKIPQVCGCMGIDCININELCGSVENFV